jgi:hypothetical protein
MSRAIYASYPGFSPAEVRTDQPTGKARLKWVVVVDETLDAGRATNAAVCVAAATAPSIAGFLGPDATDSAGSLHPGLPWAGCTILSAPASTLTTLRERAVRSEGMFVADMPSAAQQTRVYDSYLAEVAATDTLEYLAVSIIGPRNQVASMVHGLPMLS